MYDSFGEDDLDSEFPALGPLTHANITSHT